MIAPKCNGEAVDNLVEVVASVLMANTGFLVLAVGIEVRLDRYDFVVVGYGYCLHPRMVGTGYDNFLVRQALSMG